MTTETDIKAEVILHIGTMKSGTSYIQAILRRNEKLLSRDGVLAPHSIVPAVVDALGRRGSTKKERVVEGAWGRFLNSAEAWEGQTVLLSQEFLSAASASEAQGVIDTLPKGQVRVVITNRDLLRVIPSHWQTVVKNGATWPFPEYVRMLLEVPGKDGSEHRYSRGFWRHHDVAKIVDNWAGAVGADNVVLVTVPRSGAPSDLLWQRFCEAIGLDGTHYDHDSKKKSNISLTYAETEMLREVNMRVRKTLEPVEYKRIVNKYLANKLLRKPPEAGKEVDRPILGAESHATVQQRADEMVEGLAASGVRIVGDIEDLRVAPYAGDPEAVDSTAPQNRIPDSVPQALAKLVLRIARLERNVDSSRKVLDGSAASSAESPRAGGRKGGRKSASGGRQGGGGGGRRGGEGGGGGGRGARKAARRAAQSAAAQSAAAQSTRDVDDFDDFEATAYEGGEHEDEPTED